MRRIADVRGDGKRRHEERMPFPATRPPVRVGLTVARPSVGQECGGDPMSKRTRVVLIVALAALLAVPVVAVAADRFTDVPTTNVFHDDIGWLADAGVTLGCNPPANDEFCPEDPVKRQQMAAFMRRFAQYLGAEDGIVSEADHAATADSATTAGDADMLGGLPPADYQTVFSVAAGSFIDGTAVDLAAAGDTVIAASAEITVRTSPTAAASLADTRALSRLGIAMAAMITAR